MPLYNDTINFDYIKKTLHTQIVNFYDTMTVWRFNMLKNFILFTTIILVTAPVLAEELNMTPQNTFSGFNNNGIRSTYPRLNTTPAVTNSKFKIEDNRSDIMKPKSVKEMGEINPSNDGKSPMTYGQFPRNYDSSNMMPMSEIQGGMQNMFMGY